VNRTTASRAALGIGALCAGGVLAHRRFERGPASFRAEFLRCAQRELAEPIPATVITDDDLAHLPDAVASFVRASGAVGKPRIGNFHATIHGRIRGGPDERWMPFTGHQFNRYGSEPSRLFHIVASMRGVPTDVFHEFTGPDATMRAKVLSAIPIVNASGPEMTRSETVTIFNDMCLLAPSALIDATVEWETLDARTVRATFGRLDETITATLTFDETGLLDDFSSDDRFRSSKDGSTFALQRWTTPVLEYQTMQGRRVCSVGEGRWHPDPPDTEFAYLEFELDSIRYNVTSIE
jgi:hypothetical protein